MSWWIAKGGMGWHHRPGCACIKCRKARMEHEREKRQKDESIERMHRLREGVERLRHLREEAEARERIGDRYPKRMVGIPKLKICVNPDCGRGFYNHQSSDPEFCRQCVDAMKRDSLHILTRLEEWRDTNEKWREYLRERGEDPDEG